MNGWWAEVRENASCKNLFSYVGAVTISYGELLFSHIPMLFSKCSATCHKLSLWRGCSPSSR